MIEKIAHVRNPLTVIAIFAGLAEVSGTIVLPLLKDATQQIYVWFLMGFPCLLITLFFGTLIFKHHVLYAPSDYKDEQFFADTFRPATVMARELKIEEESVAAAEPVNEGEAANEGSEPTDSSAQPIINIDGNKLPLSVSNQHRRRARGLIAETVAVQNLSAEFGMPFVQNVSFEGVPDFSFDAVGQSGDRQVIVEVISPTFTKMPTLVNNRLKYFNKLWEFLSEERRHKTQFIFAVVMDKDDSEVRPMIMARLNRLSAELPFVVSVRFYELPRKLLAELES